MLCVQLQDQDVQFVSKMCGFVQGSVCKHRTRSQIPSLQELAYLGPVELVFECRMHPKDLSSGGVHVLELCPQTPG